MSSADPYGAAPVQRGDKDFIAWAEAYNLSEADLITIRRDTSLRMIIYFLLTVLTAGIMSPFLIRTWLLRKTVTQRRIVPNRGFLFNLFFLVMCITFIMVIPLILWLLIRNSGFGSGFSALYRRGLIGDGDNCRLRRQKLRQLRGKSCLFALIFSVLLVAAVVLLTIVVDGDTRILHSPTVLIGTFVFGLVLGAIIGCIITRLRFRKWNETLSSPAPVLEKIEAPMWELSEHMAEAAPKHRSKTKRTSAVVTVLLGVIVILLCVLVIIGIRLMGLRGEGRPSVMNHVSEDPGSISAPAVTYPAEETGKEPESARQSYDDEYYLDKYSAVLLRYRSIADGSADFFDYENPDIPIDGSDASRASEQRQGVTDVARWSRNFGYALRDLDGDGIRELLIGLCREPGDEFPDNVIYDMYTLTEGKAVRVFVSGERFRYYLMEDGRFYYQGSSGADDSTFCAYSYRGGTLTFEQSMGADLSALPIVSVELTPLLTANVPEDADPASSAEETERLYVSENGDLPLFDSMDGFGNVVAYVPSGRIVEVTRYNKAWGWAVWTFSNVDGSYSKEGYCNMAYLSSLPTSDHGLLSRDAARELLNRWWNTSEWIYYDIVNRYSEGSDYFIRYTYTALTGQEVSCLETMAADSRGSVSIYLSEIYTPNMVKEFMEEPVMINSDVGYAVHKGHWFELENGNIQFIPNFAMGRAEPVYESMNVVASDDGRHYVECDFIYPGQDEPSFRVTLEVVYTEEGWRIFRENLFDYTY